MTRDKKNSAKTDEKAAEERPSQEETGQKEPVKLSFTRLAITGVTVNGVVPGQEPTQVVLPDIVRENVGGSEGLTPAQVGGVIIGDMGVGLMAWLNIVGILIVLALVLVAACFLPRPGSRAPPVLLALATASAAQFPGGNLLSPRKSSIPAPGPS